MYYPEKISFDLETFIKIVLEIEGSGSFIEFKNEPLSIEYIEGIKNIYTYSVPLREIVFAIKSKFDICDLDKQDIENGRACFCIKNFNFTNAIDTKMNFNIEKLNERTKYIN